VKLKGVVRYGGATLAWCELTSTQGHKLPKIFPLKPEGNKLVLTNDLSDDLIYGQLLTLLEKQG
jgi:hypothetical protein